MNLKNRIYLVFVIITISSCNNFKKFDLEALQKNSNNQLNIKVEKPFDAEKYKNLFDQLGQLSKNELLVLMQETEAELHLISYCFYYLGNCYAAEQNLDSALICHNIAAQQYLNPQSYLKLSEWHYYREKDYAKAYELLHKSLELTVEITQNNPTHPLAKNTKTKLQFLLDALEQKARKEDFELKTVREALKETLPLMLQQQKNMYSLEQS